MNAEDIMINRFLVIALSTVALSMATAAVAQDGRYYRDSYGYGERVAPRWNRQGSAVCPDNYDFVRGWCKPRTGYRLPPRWNSAGSAVCPAGYDYRGGWCRPQRY